MMRLIGALGLSLVVGLGLVGFGAAFHPSNSLPGREAGVIEAAQVVGGGCTFGFQTHCDSNCGMGNAFVTCGTFGSEVAGGCVKGGCTATDFANDGCGG